MRKILEFLLFVFFILAFGGVIWYIALAIATPQGQMHPMQPILEMMLRFGGV